MRPARRDVPHRAGLRTGRTNHPAGTTIHPPARTRARPRRARSGGLGSYTSPGFYLPADPSTTRIQPGATRTQPSIRPAPPRTLDAAALRTGGDAARDQPSGPRRSEAGIALRTGRINHPAGTTIHPPARTRAPPRRARSGGLGSRPAPGFIYPRILPPLESNPGRRGRSHPSDPRHRAPSYAGVRTRGDAVRDQPSGPRRSVAGTALRTGRINHPAGTTIVLAAHLPSARSLPHAQGLP
jgi:hypothetical protein